MSTKTALLAIMLAAGLTGLLVAGCNNNTKRKATAVRASRVQPKAAPVLAMAGSRANANSRAVRPAEVLAATAHRSSPQTPQIRAIRAGAISNRAIEPLPEPIVLARATPQRTLSDNQSQSRPVFHAEPTQAQAPAYPQAPIVAGPELAMARSGLSPMAAPAPQAGYRTRNIPSAPIPELEPVRLRRMPSTLTTSRPVAEVMMSSNGLGRHELRQALAPIAGEPVIVAEREWVPSPTTAMLR